MKSKLSHPLLHSCARLVPPFGTARPGDGGFSYNGYNSSAAAAPPGRRRRAGLLHSVRIRQSCGFKRVPVIILHIATHRRCKKDRAEELAWRARIHGGLPLPPKLLLLLAPTPHFLPRPMRLLTIPPRPPRTCDPPCSPRLPTSPHLRRPFHCQQKSLFRWTPCTSAIPRFRRTHRFLSTLPPPPPPCSQCLHRAPTSGRRSRLWATSMAVAETQKCTRSSRTGPRSPAAAAAMQSCPACYHRAWARWEWACALSPTLTWTVSGRRALTRSPCSSPKSRPLETQLLVQWSEFPRIFSDHPAPLWCLRV